MVHIGIIDLPDFNIIPTQSFSLDFDTLYIWMWLLTFTSNLYKVLLLIPTKYLSYPAYIFSIKFIILIALLVFVRGGIPRYRYDFLTKIGWIKFLSLVLATFLTLLLLLYAF